MAATVTRTYAPLHFEALEPHRFEDLIRLLAYDFRPWRRLEPTGASGSDKGYDARGFEIVSPSVPPDGDDGDGRDDEPEVEERLWAIQAKREASINPKKLSVYATELPTDAYGVILAAPAEFSLKARDAFFSQCRTRGYQEIHLWGRRDLEDMLYQPKNDHLLFAFFGISLQIRKRTLRTQIRSRLSTRRQVKVALEKALNGSVLLRDADDSSYPGKRDEKTTTPSRGNWMVRRFEGCFHDGVRIVMRRHVAFLDDDGIQWDYAETTNEAVHSHDNPWEGKRSNQIDWEFQRNRDVWNILPEHNRAWFEITIVLPYEAILAVDADGDEICECPHIYTATWRDGKPPVLPEVYVTLNTVGSWGTDRRGDPVLENRVERFPRERLTEQAISEYRQNRPRPQFKEVPEG